MVNPRVIHQERSLCSPNENPDVAREFAVADQVAAVRGGTPKQIAQTKGMQDKTGGQKYFEFHQKMFASRGQIDGKRTLAVVRDIGFDTARIERDLKSDEVRLTIEESSRLAEALGINGTPTYVVGNEVVVGAVGVQRLRTAINTARCGKATC